MTCSWLPEAARIAVACFFLLLLILHVCDATQKGGK